MTSKRVFLDEKELPQAWYNLQADLPRPLPPPLDPATMQPVDPAKLERIFARALVAQEVSQERWIEIPEAIRRVYAIWRPVAAGPGHALERALKTPARIYFKDESHSPPGSHKPNTAVPQAYYNLQRGHPSAGHGDGGRPMGLRLGVRLQDVQPPLEGLHGQGQLPAEALPPLDDAPLGRRGHGQPFRGDQRRPADTGRWIRIARGASASPSARPWKPAAGPRGYPLHAGQRAQPRLAAPDRHRAGGGETVPAARRFPRRDPRLRRRRQQLRRTLLPLPPPQTRRPETSASSPASPTPAPR